MFKIVGGRLGENGLEAVLKDHKTVLIFLTALTLYGLSTFLWVYAIRYVQISTAYLFMSMSFVLVPLFAWHFLGETITIKYAIGVLMIIGGIFVAAS